MINYSSLSYYSHNQMFITVFTNETWLFVLPHTKPVARHLLFKHVPVFIIRIGFERKGLTYDNSLSPFISVCLSIPETLDFTGFTPCNFIRWGRKLHFLKNTQKNTLNLSRTIPLKATIYWC